MQRKIHLCLRRTYPNRFDAVPAAHNVFSVAYSATKKTIRCNACGAKRVIHILLLFFFPSKRLNGLRDFPLASRLPFVPQGTHKYGWFQNLKICYFNIWNYFKIETYNFENHREQKVNVNKAWTNISKKSEQHRERERIVNILNHYRSKLVNS